MKTFSGIVKKLSYYWNNQNDKYRFVYLINGEKVYYRTQDTLTFLPTWETLEDFKEWAKWENEV